MTLKVTYTKGLTKSELEAVKSELKGVASVRQHKERCVYGFIDIRPLKKNGYSFSQDTFNKVKQVIDKHGLTKMSTSYLNTENELYVYASGVHYIGKLV